MTIRPWHGRDGDVVGDRSQAGERGLSPNGPFTDIFHRLRFLPELFGVGCGAEGHLPITETAGYAGDCGGINDLAITPRHRRQGIGSQKGEIATEVAPGRRQSRGRDEEEGERERSHHRNHT